MVDAGHSEVIRTPSFDQRGSDYHKKYLTETLPYQWKYGGRDNVDSIGSVLGATRDHSLYKEVGCTSWEEYCKKYLHDPSDAFDEIIDGVRILRQRGQNGPISEEIARTASRAEQVPEITKRVQPLTQHGGAREGAGRPAAKTRQEAVSASEARPVSEINQADNIRLNSQYGTSAHSLAARLKRDRPDLVERMVNGEFPSFRAAAREAGWVRDPVPLKKLRKWWKKASQEERETFLFEVMKSSSV